MAKTKRVNFDDYADRYEELLQEQLAFFSKDRGYFSEYKAAIAAAQCSIMPTRVLDFGCGIGLSLPFLNRYFPTAKLFATDLSELSLAHVSKSLPNVTALIDDDVDNYTFDLIFVTGVFHHVPLDQRAKVMKRLVARLTDGGRLIVFEHNPFNPVTRHMVNTCPFDEDAELMTLRNMKRLVKEDGGIDIVTTGYCLFFPQMLARLRPLESFLRWLPLGGQYFVVGGK